MLINRVKRVAFSGMKLLVWAFYWANYYLLEKPFRRAPIFDYGASQSTGLWCICAVYQPKRTSANLVAFAACLQAAGYNVIAVHNGPAAADLVAALAPFCHTVMQRSPGGRDFGSYREGTFYLRDAAAGQDIRQVVYCNDSVFIKPSALSALLAEVRDMADDYFGAIESFERRYHVQSWFFGFSGQVFGAPWYQQFWRDYVPTSHRGRSTVQGELGLSQHAMKHGVYPRVLYANKDIIDRLFAVEKSQLLHLLFTHSSNSRAIPLYQSLCGILQPLERCPLEDLPWVMLERQLDAMSASCNPTALFNLLLLASSAFPFLKKELVYKDLYSCTQIERAIARWQNSDAEQSAEIMGFFRLRTSLRWNVVRRLMVHAGIG